MIVENILSGITQEEKEKVRTSPLRMSSSGKCARQVAYQLHGFESEPLPSRSIMVFRLGNTIETEVRALIEKYCPDLDVTFPNETISIEIDGVTVTGHVDGLIGSDTILEVKSINGRRFASLGREGIPEDYQAQATAYMKALNRNKTLFIFYCKDTSHLKEMFFYYDEERWEEIEENFVSVIRSTKDSLPERKFAPKNGKLVWQCSYCSFNKHCYPQAQLTFDPKNKPQLLIQQKGEQHA